ncbi:MAG: hypothetical protein A3D65_05650 [Candidatus Lloydbacteria bacterium RIFCSPHIGHO2_02_FULL_50_13]|uniref:Uncharacterized protein n=1 Tax=Candidatus Lloydbacteria bacterium RIFCSPHIGHO2_02_FULL_50_13 TaxID=1798661 RepID=A0A1G2D467_9BACT|nr:MAG: hypothetical protein A3D65_05650 [Candidatus Lloydbacteria bacterium RIFCSPHIGHO2_02_FULL_50_13]
MNLWEKVVTADHRITLSLERKCHKIQRKIGWTNFTLARHLVYLFFAEVVVGLGYALFCAFGAPNFFYALVIATLTLWKLGKKWLEWELKKVRQLEQAALRRVLSGTMNPEKLHPDTTALHLVIGMMLAIGFPVLWGFLGFIFASFWWVAFCLTLLAYSYLKYIDPLIPAKSESEKRLERSTQMQAAPSRA